MLAVVVAPDSSVVASVTAVRVVPEFVVVTVVAVMSSDVTRSPSSLRFRCPTVVVSEDRQDDVLTRGRGRLRGHS